MWQIILGVGIIFLLLEIFVPSAFFLNMAFAAFIVAYISLYVESVKVLIILFCILSFAFIFALRPLFLRKYTSKEQKTGIEDKYIGKVARAIEDIDKNSGAITIYDERWQARNIEDDVIKKGDKVIITGNESIVMKVKKVN